MKQAYFEIGGKISKDELLVAIQQPGVLLLTVDLPRKGSSVFKVSFATLAEGAIGYICDRLSQVNSFRARPLTDESVLYALHVLSSSNIARLYDVLEL